MPKNHMSNHLNIVHERIAESSSVSLTICLIQTHTEKSTLQQHLNGNNFVRGCWRPTIVKCLPHSHPKMQHSGKFVFAVYMRLEFICLDSKIILLTYFRERRYWVPYFVSCSTFISSYRMLLLRASIANTSRYFHTIYVTMYNVCV